MSFSPNLIALGKYLGITLFAEQANIVNLDRPYRQRIMRLMSGISSGSPLQVKYYILNEPSTFSGAGRNPA